MRRGKLRDENNLLGTGSSSESCFGTTSCFFFHPVHRAKIDLSVEFGTRLGKDFCKKDCVNLVYIMKNEKRAESWEKNTSSKVFVKSHSSSLGYFRKRFRSFVTWQSSHHSLHTHYIRTLQFIFSFLPPSISHLAPSSVLPFPPCCDFDALQITFPSPSVSLLPFPYARAWRQQTRKQLRRRRRKRLVSQKSTHTEKIEW